MLGLGRLGVPVESSIRFPQRRPSSNANVVQLRPEIEPLVRLLEETPRERCWKRSPPASAAALSYPELLAALLLAGVRNVEPRPSVGHKFHAVLVVNSAHLASMASPPEHRWLPIFWALDHYKSARPSDVEERGDWTMTAVDESAVPPAHRGRPRVSTPRWTAGTKPAADAAIAGLARTAGANDVYETSVPLRHARLPLDRPQGDLRRQQLPHAAVHRLAARRAGAALAGLRPADARGRQPGRARRRRRPPLPPQPWSWPAKIRRDWRDGKLDHAATTELLGDAAQPDRTTTPATQVVELLNRGVAPQSIWDALHVGAGELLMRQPGIVVAARRDDDQRPALRLPGQRQRRDTPAAACCRTPRSCRCSAARWTAAAA